jgi:hypothetical protein
MVGTSITLLSGGPKCLTFKVGTVYCNIDQKLALFDFVFFTFAADSTLAPTPPQPDGNPHPHEGFCVSSERPPSSGFSHSDPPEMSGLSLETPSPDPLLYQQHQELSASAWGSSYGPHSLKQAGSSSGDPPEFKRQAFWICFVPWIFIVDCKIVWP